MDEPEEIPPELSTLFAAAREVSPSEQELAQLRASLGARLATPLPAPSALSPAALGSFVAAGLGALAIVVYLAWPQLTSEGAPAARDANGEVNGEQSQPPSHVPVVPPAEPAAAEDPAPHQEGSAPSDEEPTPGRPRPLPSEENLVDRAQRALPASPARTLSFAARHRRLYPDGILAQERELLAIDALTRLERFDDARARVARFVARWPSSPHLRRVRRLALEEEN